MAFPDTRRPIQPANTGSEPEPPGATTSAENNRTQNPPERGPNDPVGDPAVDLTRTIDDPKPPRGGRGRTVSITTPGRAGRTEGSMARGDKSKYTDKQKRQAEHIEEGYERRGTSKKEAERRAWATVNKETGGGKKSGSGRGKKTSHASSRKGGHKGGQASAHRSAAQRSASARKAARTRARRGH